MIKPEKPQNQHILSFLCTFFLPILSVASFAYLSLLQHFPSTSVFFTAKSNIKLRSLQFWTEFIGKTASFFVPPQAM